MRAGASLATVAGMNDVIDACRIVVDELLSWLRGPQPTAVVPVVVLRDPPVARIRHR
jgi:hypothetical protein